MAAEKYMRLIVDGAALDVEQRDDLPIAITFASEEAENFQQKKGATSLDITVPATVENQQVLGSIGLANVEDMTAAGVYGKPRRASLEADGCELIVGKAFVKSATHRDRVESIRFDLYGETSDWVIDLKEATLFDALAGLSFTFDQVGIEASWNYDGRDADSPFVFAPVRYAEAMERTNATNPLEDYIMQPAYMKPSLSVYWIIFRAFALAGYKIESSFFNTDYFRRLVMPWTWGNFLESGGTRMDNLDFLAKGARQIQFSGDNPGQYIDVEISNDSTNGAFDNQGVYEWNAAAREARWTYLPAFNYGALEAVFHFQAAIEATVTANSTAEVRVRWFKNGSQVRDFALVNINAPSIGRRDANGLFDDWATISVVPGDVVSAKIYLYTFESSLGRASVKIEVLAHELEFFRIPLGGTISFDNYTGLKKYKVLDLIRGVADLFNLSFGTDSVARRVFIEPAHPFSLSANLADKSGGYYTGDAAPWTEKIDLSDPAVVSVAMDGERELLFRFREDTADGLLKKVQDRNSIVIGAAKYVLPERHKAGRREVENRFFSPVIHYEVRQWDSIGSRTTQMVALVPENISNTSRAAAGNTFQPKICYYKGIEPSMGWNFAGTNRTGFPFMFAVNYTTGGENDPVLSYSDERIPGADGNPRLGAGLLRRFFWQRLANMRAGIMYEASMRLNTSDVFNRRHRDHKIILGHKWELISIKDFKPLVDKPTRCMLRRVEPISRAEKESTFPSESAVLQEQITTDSFDTKYYQLKSLSSDIPK
jgi:hypothetical protein